MTRQAEENREHNAALDDLLKQKQELIQDRDNQVSSLLIQLRIAGPSLLTVQVQCGISL